MRRGLTRGATRGATQSFVLALLALSATAATLRAQGRGACAGGGTGHVRVAPRVDAVYLYERCLGGDRLAAIVLWRARADGWSADPDAVAFDQRARTLVVTARDGAHPPLTLGRSDSVLVVMLDWVDAVAGPIPLTTTRLAPASATGLAPPVIEMREAARGRAPAPTRVVADRLRTLLALDGRSRQFIGL